MKLFYIFIITIILFGSINQASVIQKFKLKNEVQNCMNYEHSIKNLSDETYCDSIGINNIFNLYKGNYKPIITKYLNKLPHSEIQKELIKKYNIDPRIIILINFQESNFDDIINNGDLNMRKSGICYKDWGSMQMNSRYYPEAKHFIQDKNYYGYYDFAYKTRILGQKSKNIKTWFMNWHSCTDKHRNNYYKDFLIRTIKKNKDLRQLMN